MCMSEDKKARKSIDWAAVERDYRLDKFTLRELESMHGISYAQISRKAKAACWHKSGFIATIEGYLVDRQISPDYSKPGFVYVIYITDSAGLTAYKIGMAANVDARLRSHQTSSPFDICIAMAYFCGNMAAEEAALHAKFQGKRIRGEWFHLDDADLKSIAERSLLV